MTNDKQHRPLETAAFEYIERGVSIIPIHPTSKRPMVKWKDFQNRIATEEDIAYWQRYAAKHKLHPAEIALAAVTGALSGFVIVDCDSPEAVEHCRKMGVWSPVRVRTKHGLHLYFQHPKDREYRPRVGSNSKGIDWPILDGLDFRGDGSYALIPPSKNYVWEVDPGFDYTDPTDWPMWTGWPMEREQSAQPSLPEQPEHRFSDLDLTAVAVKGLASVWQATADFVAESFPRTLLIPSGQGNGRNQRVLSYAAEQIMFGFWGDLLDERVLIFMDNFFEERLSEDEWKATCRSVEAMERANHPERFTEDGTYVPPYSIPMTAEERRKEDSKDEEDGTILGSQVIARLQSVEESYYVNPMVPTNCIMQVTGYTGQGKSTFIQMLIHALAIGRKTFGPLEIEQVPDRILYLNYEEGRRTIKERMVDNIALLGDFKPEEADRLVIYAPSIANDEGLNLTTNAGRKRLGALLRRHRPDIVVIDTVRSAFPGLDENNAASWTPINDLCLYLRNKGVSVIMLHHRNKATKDGMGSYAGSTNQLTVVEVQVYVTQLYADEETAAARGGKFDQDNKVHAQFYNRLPGGAIDWVIDWVMEIEYGKTREWTDDMDKRQWIALATNIFDDRQTLIALPSSKQRAVQLYHQNCTIAEICQAVHRRKSTVLRWLKPHDIKPKP